MPRTYQIKVRSTEATGDSRCGRFCARVAEELQATFNNLARIFKNPDASLKRRSAKGRLHLCFFSGTIPGPDYEATLSEVQSHFMRLSWANVPQFKVLERT